MVLAPAGGSLLTAVACRVTADTSDAVIFGCRLDDPKARVRVPQPPARQVPAADRFGHLAGELDHEIRAPKDQHNERELGQDSQPLVSPPRAAGQWLVHECHFPISAPDQQLCGQPFVASS